MSNLRRLLENPPRKKQKCHRCNGSGIVNRRGMILSDPCPRCKDGIETVIDYEAWCQAVRDLLLPEKVKVN